MRAHLAAMCIAACSFLGAAQGAAQPNPNDDAACSDKEFAKREFVKGRLAYRRGDYEEAILKWQDSYAACPKPLTLFNIGNAYERMGDLKAALKHFEQYRPLAEKHEQADLDSRMEGLRKRIAVEDQLDADRRAKDEAAAQAERERQAREEEERRRRAAASGGKLIPIVGWSLVGVGGAAIIAGVVMDVVAAGKRPDQAAACTGMGDRLLCRDAERDAIESSNTLALAGDITWIAGSVVGAGGATLLILDALGVLKLRTGGPSQPDAAVQAVQVIPLPTGVALTGRF